MASRYEIWGVKMRVRVEVSTEASWDGTKVVQCGQASSRVGVKTSQAQGGGGLAQAKVIQRVAADGPPVRVGEASRKPSRLTSTMKERCLRARESGNG